MFFPKFTNLGVNRGNTNINMFKLVPSSSVHSIKALHIAKVNGFQIQFWQRSCQNLPCDCWDTSLIGAALSK